MNNSNWHVPLNKMNEQQLEVVKRVYGIHESDRYLTFDHPNTLTSINDSEGEEITPEEAFKRLGLDRLLDTDLATVNNLKVQNKALKQELAECERQLEKRGADLSQVRQANIDLCKRVDKLQKQLASQSEQGLQGVDWSLVEPEYGWLVQRKSNGEVAFLDFCPEKDGFCRVIATRPKPKYTKEQIDAVRDAVMYYQKHIAYKVRLNFDELQAVDAEQWLKEQGYE